jgi:hypothetical protein
LGKNTLSSRTFRAASTTALHSRQKLSGYSKKHRVPVDAAGNLDLGHV